MFKVIAAHFRKVGHAFAQCFNEIATGIETDNPDLKQTGLWGLWRLLLPRLILWGIPGVYYTIKDVDLLTGYIEFIVIFFIVAAIIAATTTAPEPPKQEEVVFPSDAVVMKEHQF